MSKLTDEQRRVLKRLQKYPRSSAKEMRCGIRTMMGLSRRGLIYVGTTFDSIAFPRNAPAELTPEGAAALNARS